jgi:large repetitive protein
MSVNGASLQSLLVSDGNFSGSGYLEEGMNTVEFAAELEGRGSRVKRTVTFAPGKPVAAITFPAEDARTEQQQILLSGLAATDASVVLEVDGATITPAVQGGAFQQQIALSHPGLIPVVATVTDNGGNSSVVRRNIVKMQRVMGDLNGDGLVNIQDAMTVLRMAVGLDQVTPEALAHADVAPLVNGVPHPDGKIDVGDVLIILRKVVGLVDF